jgi:hypothetical protein
MKSVWLVALVVSCVLFADKAGNAQEQNTWHYKGGWLQVSRGWIDWQRNDVDGRYCLFSGHSATAAENDVWCYNADTNQWQEVYPGDRSATQPIGGDLHAWGWDHVGKEYFLFDSGKTGWRSYAFNPITRTWRQLNDTDFSGLSGRTFISSSGTATSPDHDLMVITHGGGYPTRVVRFLDLRNGTYSEINSPSNPPVRTFVQNQFLYISSIRKFLLFGGSAGTQYFNDLWLLDPVTRTWMPIAHVNPPPGNSNAQMAYDSVQDVVYLTGGDRGTAQVSILQVSNWTWQHLPLPAGSAFVDYPSRRRNGGAMFHPVAGFCNVAGGLQGGTWIESLRTWCFKHAVSTDTVPPAQPPAGGSDFVPSNLGDLIAGWSRSADDPGDVARYEAERSENNGVTWIDAVNVTANGSSTYTHTYKGVPDGPFRVRAVDAAGNRSPYLMVSPE